MLGILTMQGQGNLYINRLDFVQFQCSTIWRIQMYEMKAFGGYLIEEEKILQSASGGCATGFAEEILKQGGYVAGVVYSEDFKSSEYLVTNDTGDIHRMKGSKYVEVRKGTIYQDVKTLVEQGKTVLFFGIPCSVYALYSVLGYRPDNLITCELVCHGPINESIHREYIEYLEKQYKSNIVSFSVRYKKQKWEPKYLRADFVNGQYYEEELLKTEYGKAFGIYAKEGCYSCRFKAFNSKGDVMLGDFWGASEKDEYWNEKGVSLVIAETEKGENFIKNCRYIKLFKAEMKSATNSNPSIMKPRKKHRDYDRFEKLYKKKNLFYATKHCEPITERAKNIYRNLMRKLKNSY